MNPTSDKPIIFFDGVCNLCNVFVKFIIRHDKQGKFRFASLQSEIARQLLPGINESETGLSTVILLDQGKIYVRSRAVLRIVRQLDGLWKIASVLYIFPSFISDFVYNLVAKTRYRLFGRRESCMVPTPEIKSRFV